MRDYNDLVDGVVSVLEPFVRELIISTNTGVTRRLYDN